MNDAPVLREVKYGPGGDAEEKEEARLVFMHTVRMLDEDTLRVPKERNSNNVIRLNFPKS